MKLIPEKNQAISLVALALIMAIMPLYYRFLPPAVILLGIGWLIEKNFRPGLLAGSIPEYRVLLILFSVFFLWQVITLMYSEDQQLGWSNIGTRLSLLVFPLVLFNSGRLIRMNRMILLQIFALAATIYMLICFGYALERSLSFIDGKVVFNPITPDAKWLNYFYGSDLVFSIHPTYMAMFVLVAAFISFESARARNLKRGIRTGWMLNGLFLLVSVYFISSRAGMLAAVIMVPVYLANLLINAKKHRLVWAIVLFVTILAVLPLFLRNARLSFFLNSLSEANYELRGQDNRFIVWRHATSLAKEKPLMGYGIGDARNELAGMYLEAGNEKLYNERFNAHNQFMENVLEGGIIQFFIFTLLLGYMIYLVFHERNMLYGLFIVMVLVFFMFESVLYRLAGVTFFSLFSFMLLKYPEEKINR